MTKNKHLLKKAHDYVIYIDEEGRTKMCSSMEWRFLTTTNKKEKAFLEKNLKESEVWI